MSALRYARALVGAATVLSLSLGARAQCQLDVRPGAPLAGVEGKVLATAVVGGELYVGGVFSIAGSTEVRNVARWDGTGWRDVGGGVDGSVDAMVVDGNGDLVVGGNFQNAGGVQANRVARWDGTTWSPLGSGLGAIVRGLAVLQNGDIGAVGSFLTSGSGTQLPQLARFDGASWLPLGGPGLMGSPYDLVELANGDLLVVGVLLLPGASFAPLVRWNGAGWTAVPAPTTGVSFTYRLVELPNGEIALGGHVPVGGPTFAIYDGTSIVTEACPVDGRVLDLEPTAGGGLLATGLSAGFGTRVARRDPNGQWTLLFAGPGEPGQVTEYAGEVVATRSVASGGFGAPAIQAFDGSSWRPLGGTAPAIVEHLVVDDLGVLYAAGRFDEIDGVAARRVARRVGGVWQPLGAGLDGDVIGLAALPGGGCVVVGFFDDAGGAPAAGIACWHGSAWSTLGAGLAGQPRGGVVVGAGGSVYVATTLGVEVFSGATWSLVPPPPGLLFVDHVVEFEGDLVAGSISSTPASAVQRWDGAAWSAMGSTTNCTRLVASPAGELFQATVTASGHEVQRWDGSQWQPLGTSFDTLIRAMAVLPDGDVLAAGGFLLPGGVDRGGVVRWDGSAWTIVVNGLEDRMRSNAIVHDLAVDRGGSVWLGSDFARVDGVVAAGLAELETTCPATTQTAGSGCFGAGGPMQLEARSLPWIGAATELRATGFASPGLAVRAFGTQPASLPLLAGATGCTVLLQPIVLDLGVPTQGVFDSVVDVADNPALVGQVFRAQVFGLEFTGQALQRITATNAVDLTIGAF